MYTFIVLLSSFYCRVVIAEYKTYYMDNYCMKKDIELDLPSSYFDSGSILKATDQSYNHTLDCTMHLDVTEEYGVLLAVDEVHLHEGDLLTIKVGSTVVQEWYSESTSYNQSLFFVSEKKTKNGLHASYIVITIKIATPSDHSGFTFYLTVYKHGNCSYVSPNIIENALNFEINSVVNDAFYTSCRPNMCISYLLLCDGINNCGKWEEEVECKVSGKLGAILGVCGGTGVLGAFLGKKYYNKKKESDPEGGEDGEYDADVKTGIKARSLNLISSVFKKNSSGKNAEKSEENEENEEIDKNTKRCDQTGTSQKMEDTLKKPNKKVSGATCHYKLIQTVEVIRNDTRFTPSNFEMQFK